MNDKVFFQEYKKLFGPLNQRQVDGLNFLLLKLKEDLGTNLVDTLEQVAYILATIKHETADTYQPIREYGRGKGMAYGAEHPVTGQKYYGRGYVQLTWYFNYKKLGDLLNIDLLNNPDLALDPETAYKIMIIGLDQGLFGYDIDRAISEENVDYVNARRAVNGKDRAKLIANYAKLFFQCLKISEFEK